MWYDNYAGVSWYEAADMIINRGIKNSVAKLKERKEKRIKNHIRRCVLKRHLVPLEGVANYM